MGAWAGVWSTARLIEPCFVLESPDSPWVVDICLITTVIGRHYQALVTLSNCMRDDWPLGGNSTGTVNRKAGESYPSSGLFGTVPWSFPSTSGQNIYSQCRSKLQMQHETQLWQLARADRAWSAQQNCPHGHAWPVGNFSTWDRLETGMPMPINLSC